MKTFKNKKGLFYGFLFFLITTIFVTINYSSCEVGLGGAVDIQSPVVSITYPPSLSVIRDSFVLAGTWSDDHGVKTVHVDVYQSLDEGKKLVHQEEATVSLDGNWSITLNNFDKNNTSFYNGWEFADGDYEIQVTAEDHVKHFSGIASRTISIDNTAPVLVITNPTTAGSDATPAAFGQIVQLKGSFYDFCGKLTGLTVTFYDETGKAICDSSFSNISDMSDANPLTIARYYSTEEDRANNSAVYNNYKALFGTDKLESFEADAPITNSKIYFTVTANDSAKEFKTIGDEGVGKGNITKIFYRGTTSMQNLVSGDGAIEDFSLVDFASYLNKTSTKYSSSASTIDSIAAAAQSFSTTKAETPSIASFITNNDSTHGDPVYLTCTINPKNNPQYIIGGYELIEAGTGAENYSSAGYKTVYHGSPVPLNITVGADNKNISTHTVSFYLVDTTEYTGEINAGIFEQQHNPEYVELLYTWDEDVYNRYSAWGQDMSSRYTASSEDTNVSSIAKQFTIESLKPSHDYLFYVVGKDITGNDIIAADARGYGFCYTVSTTAPEITITGGNKLNEVVSAKKFNGENASGLNDLLFITGTIKTEKVLNSLSYILTVTESSDSENPPTLQKTYSISPQELASNPGYTYSSPNYCYTTNAAVSPITYYWQIATARVASDFATIIAHPGSYDVTLVIKANNDAESSTQRTFTLDTKAPEAEATEISNSVEIEGGGYWINPGKAYKIKGLVTDNLSTPNACKTWIVLKAIDENEAELDATYSTESNKATGVKTWEFTVPANAIDSSNYGANLYIYSQDVAGNTGVTSPSQLVKLYFDTVAPKGIHLIDYKNKDIVFRVSDFDSSATDVATTAGAFTYDDKFDKDVGGKYLKGSYSNTSTLKIRGYFEEDGSGVDMIYYKVFNTPPSDQDITNFKKDYANSESTDKATGYFKPLENPEEKQVMFQIKEKDEDETDNIDDSWYAVKVKSTFKETISGLDHSHNYLVLLAVDKVGNLDVDTLEGEWIKHKAEDEVLTWKESSGGDVNKTGSPADWNGPFKGFSLNVDSESPILNCTSHSGQQYTNGVSEITVSGTFTDNPSGTCAGVSSISINIHGVDSYAELTPVAENDYSSGTWEAKILSSTLSALEQGETYNANGTIKDRAGNTSSATMFTLSFDKEGPTVKVETPAKNTKVNGTISMTGSVEYVGSAPVKLELYAQKTAPSGELTGSPVETITDTSKIYSWNITDIDTYTITNVEASSTTSDLYIIPVVTDGAGNTNIYDLSTSSYKYTLDTNYFKYTVDMDSDRPTVKFTNLTNVAAAGQSPVYILKFGDQSKLEGNVSDDDSNSTSVVDTFIVSASQITAAPTNGSDGWTRTQNGNEITWTKAGEGSTKFNVVTGDYTYTPPVTADGQKRVYFLVKDNGGQVFYTGHTTGPYQPYQQYKAETATKIPNTTYLEYKSDGTSPTISDVKLVLQYKWQNVKTKQNATTTYFTDSACATNASESTADTAIVYKAVDPGTGTVVGGTNQSKVIFLIKATDANGIKEMNLKYTPFEGAEQTITSSSGTFTATTTATEAVWITDEISVADFTTGSVNVAVTAYDQSDLFANQNPVFMVDNTGPSINISSPSSNDEVSGAVSIAGQATDSGGAGEPTIHFLIPTSAQKNAMAASGKTDLEYYKTLAVGAGNWIGNLKAEKTPAAFEFVFNGDVNDNASLDIYTKSDTSGTYGLTPDTEGIYLVPIYFRSQDALGNINVIKFTARYNPDADKPRTEISYPSAANYQGSNEFVTLGGTIRVTGSVTIPSLSTTPEKVYIQIASQDGDWGTTDKEKAGTGTGNYGYTVKTIANVESDIGKTVTGFTTTALSDAWWGIEAVRSSNAWSFNLNENGQLNPESGVNAIKIRACAVNAGGKMGAWSEPVSIHIDASAPEYTTKLYQFSNAPAVGAQTAEKEYEPGMFLKGQWYIGIHLTDNDGIHDSDVATDLKKIKVQRNGENVASSDITKIWKVTDDANSDYHKELDLYIKLSNTLVTQSYKVDVCDTAEPEHWVYPTYEIKVDNDAPVLGSITTGEGYPLSMTKQRTSNKVITFGTTATDAGSGFNRLAFYFKRGSSIELPVPAVENANQKKWKVGSAYTEDLTVTQDNLYGVNLNGTKDVSGTNTTFTSSAIGSYSFIRKGGIVKMAGTYHLITDVSGNVVTVSGKIDSSVTSAFFPAAFIVDNTSAEGSTWSNDGINTISGDDGDGIVESVKKSGTTWTWDTSIYAGELDDGEVTLVCVAFDVAENSAKSETTFMLTNKTPRLSKLYLATDLNGDGKYSDEELGTSVITASGAKTVEKYYSALNAGNLQEVFTVYGNTDDQNNSTTTSGITMRDNMGIAFEFISGYEGYGEGQGDMKYKLSVSQTAISDAETGTTDTLGTAADSKYANTTTTAGLRGKKFLELTPVDFTANTPKYSGYTELKVSGENGYNAQTNYLNYLHITLWDNSNNKSGTKDGTKTSNNYTNNSGVASTYDTYTSFGAQWTAINIPLYMDLVDGVRPTVTINDPVPLSDTQGHVDLSSTLSSTNFSGSNELDTDDKVSGKIKFTGTINDERRISTIKLTVNKSFSNKTVNGVTLATYSTSTALFDNTTIVPNSATGLTFKINSSSFSNSTGHTVEWELEVDSEKVGNNAVADKDVLFTLTANDGTGDGTGTHQVDIVPYITKLHTALADSAGEEFARSATGKYVVRANETVRMYGYNLKAGTNAVTVSYASGDPTSITSTTPNNDEVTAYGSHLKVSVGANAKSGKVTITVNGVQSLNNLNTNPTFESLTDDTVTAYANNSQANGITNNRLNDDVELWVWDMGSFFTTTKKVYSPTMKMDAASNVYMAYGLGADNMILRENNKEYIVDYGYNKFVNTAVAYSSDNKAFGIGTCTDRVNNYSASSVFYTWRTSDFESTQDPIGREYTYSRKSKYHLEKAYNNTTKVYDTDRVQKPKMEISGSSDGAKVYMVYYDNNNSISPVKFRYGQVNGTDQDDLTATLGLKGVSSNYNGTGMSLNQNNNPTTGTGGSGQNFHIVASDNTTFKGGPYTAVGYTSAGAAVVAWYDTSRKAVILSWNTAPQTAVVGGVWQTNAVIIDDNYAGWYLDMCVDAADGIHLAYYNSSRGDLKYVYIPDYTQITKNETTSKITSGATIVTVDSYLSVGTNITINVRDEGTGTGNAHVAKYVPYIYYYNTSNNQTSNSIKVAWRDDMTTLRDGAINDKFTGAWECMTIPTTNIPVDATVCGGVPTSGTYANSVVLGYMTDVYYEKASIKK